MSDVWIDEKIISIRMQVESLQSQLNQALEELAQLELEVYKADPLRVMMGRMVVRDGEALNGYSYYKSTLTTQEKILKSMRASLPKFDSSIGRVAPSLGRVFNELLSRGNLPDIGHVASLDALRHLYKGHHLAVKLGVEPDSEMVSIIFRSDGHSVYLFYRSSNPTLRQKIAECNKSGVPPTFVNQQYKVHTQYFVLEVDLTKDVLVAKTLALMDYPYESGKHLNYRVESLISTHPLAKELIGNVARTLKDGVIGFPGYVGNR